MQAMSPGLSSAAEPSKDIKCFENLKHVSMEDAGFGIYALLSTLVNILNHSYV